MREGIARGVDHKTDLLVKVHMRCNKTLPKDAARESAVGKEFSARGRRRRQHDETAGCDWLQNLQYIILCLSSNVKPPGLTGLVGKAMPAWGQKPPSRLQHRGKDTHLLREMVMVRCLAPEASAVMNGRLMSV